MKAPKAIRLLHTLSPQELNRLEEFLASPYFNKSEALRNYFNALKELDFGRQDLEKDISASTWALAFPQKPFSKSYYDKLNSDLFTQLKTFFQVEALENPQNKIEKEVGLAKIMAKNGMTKLFSIQAKKTEKELEDSILLDSRLLTTYISLQDAIYNMEIADSRANLEKRSKKIEKAMEEEFLIQWLKFVSGILLNSTQREIDRYFLSHLKSRTNYYQGEIRRSPNPILQIHFCIYELCTDQETEENYRFLIRWMEEYGSRLPVSELETVMRFSMAFSARKANLAGGVFIKHTHELHRIAEDHQIFASQESLRPDVFYFVVQMALQSTDMEWARYFFDTYIDKVEQVENPMLVGYLDARINFSLSNFAQAREILENGMQTTLKHSVISWNVRYLLLKCYFELRELDKFENLIESTRQFLGRNQEGLKGVYKKGQNSLRALRILYRIENLLDDEVGKNELRAELKTLQEKGKITDLWFAEKVK